MKTTIPFSFILSGITTLMLLCCINSAISTRLAAAEPRSTPGAAAKVRGNLLLEAKGEVEVYQNGKKIGLRDKLDGQHFLVKVPAREFKAGDAIVLHVRSPFVFRTISAAINLDGKAGQIPVKKAHWRFMGEGAVASNITAEDILACQTMLETGTPDGTGESEREKLGMIPNSKGGPDWVKTAKQFDDWYCVGFVLTDEMLKSPLAAASK